MAPSPEASRRRWTGTASTAVPPPEDYWAHLAREHPPAQVAALKDRSDARQGELGPGGLPPPPESAKALLERVADDGWLEREQRFSCPDCGEGLSAEESAGAVCPHCGEAFARSGGVAVETAYVRRLAPQHSVDWVVAVHGMNTRGAWQESFGWLVGTTWGRSVPVFVYKYGKVVAGVLIALRRRSLKARFRSKLAALFEEARARGYRGRPDAVAHSFGTWILGHVLRDELRRDPAERLRFGRIILTGSILRPDFDWAGLKREGLVEEVLNHYGTRDPVVPLAELAIADSGPSGRRGFDGREAVNVRAEGYGHSDLFAVDRWVAGGRPFRPRADDDAEHHMEHAYRTVWRPFLTFPARELDRIPGRADPPEPWRPLPWPLRGTVLPVLAVPLLASLLVLLAGAAGSALAWPVPVLEEAASTLVVRLARWLAAATGAGLALLLLAAGGVLGWRRLARRLAAGAGPTDGVGTEGGRPRAPEEVEMADGKADSPLIREIEREIRARRLYAKSDFVWNHFVVLVIALSSAVPAMAEIFELDRPKLVAAVAALPALLVLLQRTFLWHERGEWHWDYRRKLMAIYRQIRDQGLGVEDASARLNELEKDLAGTFPGLRSTRSQE